MASQAWGTNIHDTLRKAGVVCPTCGLHPSSVSTGGFAYYNSFGLSCPNMHMWIIKDFELEALLAEREEAIEPEKPVSKWESRWWGFVVGFATGACSLALLQAIPR